MGRREEGGGEEERRGWLGRRGVWWGRGGGGGTDEEREEWEGRESGKMEDYNNCLSSGNYKLHRTHSIPCSYSNSIPVVWPGSMPSSESTHHWHTQYQGRTGSD